MDADLMASLSKLLAPILSSPDAMRSLASLFGGGEGDAVETARVDDETEKEAASAPASAAPREGERSKRREALLHALRPYLSPSKGERLEGLVRASAMLELLGGTGKG